MENDCGKTGKVTMLGLSYCLYSKGARLYLEKRRVDFVYIDVDRLRGRSRLEAEAILARLSPDGALPLTVVGDEAVSIIGYDRKKLREFLALMPLLPEDPAKAEDPASARQLALAKLLALLDRFPAVHSVASGVAGVAHEVKSHLGGVAGVAHEVKNHLGGVAGVAHEVKNHLGGVASVAHEVKTHLGHVASEVKTHVSHVASEVKNQIGKDGDDDTPFGMF